MREFKFRAWKEHCGFAFFRLGKKPMWSGEYSSNHSYYFTGVESADKIEQFTGVKDKNGVEIYKGDIVKVYFPAGYGYKAREISIEVVWRECGFIGRIIGNENKHPVCHHKTLTNENWLYEVIGNIRENSELLESGK